MNDKAEWIKKGGLPFETSEETAKHVNCEKEIEKLAERYGWSLEDKIQDLLHSVILVKTDIPAQNMRDLDEIEGFKGDLEGILKRYGLDFRDSGFDGKGISKDRQKRRIEIRLKKIS